MHVKHSKFSDMESDPWVKSRVEGCPACLHQSYQVCIWGELRFQALVLTSGTGSQPLVASPDFLLCPHLDPWERLLDLASLHPQGMQLLRNSQLFPSPTLSFQTKPVKTELRWQLQPHLATAHVHSPPAGSASQTLHSRCK